MPRRWRASTPSTVAIPVPRPEPRAVHDRHAGAGAEPHECKRGAASARVAARRGPGDRIRAHDHGPELRPGARRPRRRGDQDRADRGRQHAPADGHRRRILGHLQPQQEKPGGGPEIAAGHRHRDQAARDRRRRDGKLPPRHHGQARPGLRRREQAAARDHLLFAQGLPARPVRAAHGAGRGGADDGRTRLHDRAARADPCAPAHR